MRYSQWFVALVVLMGASQNTWADENTAQITVNVTINAAPCVINNNQNIDVDFGDQVAVTDVAAGLVQKDIIYDLDCSNAVTAKSLEMQINGPGADFDANALKTSTTNLGVIIKADGADFPLNSGLILASRNAKPVLKALLVQKPGTRLETGEFTASATMTVDYQ